MKQLLFFLFFLNSLNALSQPYKSTYVDFTEINVNRIAATFGEKWCMDSTFRRRESCSLDSHPSDVEFFKAYYNRKTKELLLIGRATASSTVGIFISNSKTTFTKDSLLGYTSESSVEGRNYGFFDVVFTLNNNRSLFFFSHNYSYTRFDIGRMQKSLNKQSKRFR